MRQQQFGALDVTQDNQPKAQGQPHARSIWIGEQALLDVAGRAVTAVDGRGRRYGEVQSGGSIVIGGEIDPGKAIATSADAFVIVRPVRDWRPPAARHSWMYRDWEGFC